MLFAAAALGFASCEDYPDAFVLEDGVPTVHYVRYADREVLIDQAYMGEIVCFVGENLCSVRELYFNEHPAVLNTSYMTANTLIAAVPGKLPQIKTDKVYMITKNKDTVTVDFKVMMPAPQVKSMSYEYAAPGEEITIYGDYFSSPLTIDFVGKTVTDADYTINVSKTALTLNVPEGGNFSSLGTITTEKGQNHLKITQKGHPVSLQDGLDRLLNLNSELIQELVFCFCVVITVHGEGIHIVLFKSIGNLSSRCSVDLCFTVFLECHLRLKVGRAAYATAVTHHSLDEVLRKSVYLHKKESFLNICAAAYFSNFNVSLDAFLFEVLKNCCCYTAAVSETLSSCTSLVVLKLFRLKLYALRAH